MLKSVVGLLCANLFDGLIFNDAVVRRESCYIARFGHLSADDR